MSRVTYASAPPTCPPGYAVIPTTIPPYFVCVPLSSGVPTTTTSQSYVVPATTTRPSECTNAYSPVLTVYNKKIPVVYQTVAFTFDIYTETAKVPIVIAEKSGAKSGAGVAVVTPASVLDVVGKLIVSNVKKISGVTSVTFSKIDTVLNPICYTSYILFRAKTTAGVAEEYRPMVISGRESEVVQLIASSVIAGVHSSASPYKYTVAKTVVQFINTPDEFTSFVYSLLGTKRGGTP